MSNDRTRPALETRRYGEGDSGTVTLKVRTLVEQRIRAGFVFGKTWKRVDVTRDVAKVIEADESLAVVPISSSDDKIEAAQFVGTPSNLPDPNAASTAAAKQKARIEARRQLDREIAAAEAEEKRELEGKSTAPASPPEGPKGDAKRGEDRKT